MKLTILEGLFITDSVCLAIVEGVAGGRLRASYQMWLCTLHWCLHVSMSPTVWSLFFCFKSTFINQ
jgi:hypothetical protein